jgi:histidyl-tRNA synthetase
LRAKGLSCDLDYADRSAKGQFKQADRVGARFAVIIGDEELAVEVCSLRDMASGEQRTVSVMDVPEELLGALRP